MMKEIRNESFKDFLALENSISAYAALLVTFSYLYVEKVLFLSQIFEVEILMDLHVLRSPESENHIFSKWSVYMCLCVCLCVCYQHNSKTSNSRNI